LHDPPDENPNESRLIEAAEREADEWLASARPVGPPREAVAGFEILDEIGRGGMGVVYRARQLSTKRVTALKIMLGGWFASQSARNRFQREVELASRFQHAGIVRVLESGLTTTGQPYYAMDYVDAVHLDRWLTAARADVPTTLRLFIEVCEAVEHAHAQGVIHRDLKPANILIDSDGAPHILDFGLSKATDQIGDESLTVTASMPGHMLGTLRYMSPEQAAGRPGEIDARTDVYSIGVMLYEALTDSAPFGAKDDPSTFLRKICEVTPAPPSSVSDRVDRELETVILKALEKDRGLRYQSAADLAEDLEHYLADEPLRARPVSRLYMLRKKASKQRGRIAWAAALVVLATATFFASAWRTDRQRTRQKWLELTKARQRVIEAQHFLDVGRVHDALETANALFTQYPELVEACMVWAKARFVIAEQTADESLRDIALGSLKGQLAQYRKHENPSAWVLNLLLAECYSVIGLPAADELREQAVLAAPDTAEAWFLRSLATFDFEKALGYAEAAVERDNRFERGWRRLAYMYASKSDDAGAVNAARAIVRLGGARYYWTMFQGRVLAKAGRYAEAEACYGGLAKDFPNQSSPRKALGVVALCRMEYDAAAAYYTVAAEIEGADEMWTRYARGTPLWILGRHVEAAEDYRHVRGLRSQVSYADARLYLVMRDHARRLADSGDAAQAAQLLSQAEAVLEEALRNVMPNSRLEAMLECLAGTVDPSELSALVDEDCLESACEFYYYAGESCLLNDRPKAARGWFEKCLGTGLALDPDSTKLDAMNEYHLARWRLDETARRTTHAAP